MQKGLSDILGGNLAAEKIAGHVLGRGHSVCGRALLDEFRRQQPPTNAVGIDGVGADAVRSVFERVLPDEE